MGRCSISGASSTTLAGRRTAGKGRASKLSLLLSLFFLATCQKLSLLPFFYLFSFFGCWFCHTSRDCPWYRLFPSLSLSPSSIPLPPTFAPAQLARVLMLISCSSFSDIHPGRVCMRSGFRVLGSGFRLFRV